MNASVFVKAAAAAAMALALMAGAANAAEPVARVNGEDISEAEVAVAETEFGSVIAGLPPEARRRVIVEYLIEAHLLAQAARKEKLDAGPEYDTRLKYYMLRALRDLFIEVKGKEQVTEKAARAVYDQQIASIKPEEEVSARHILVKTKEEADAIIKDIKGGADFAKIAEEKSLDTGSGTAGGDLGYFSRNMMVKAFEDAAFTLKKGELSAPVQTEFGWHVIRVDDKRNRPLPAFEDVKDQIISSLVQTKLQEVVQGLRASAKIEIVDPEIKKAMEQEAAEPEPQAEPEKPKQ